MVRTDDSGLDNRSLYAARFSDRERRERARLWQTLVDHFLNRYIPEDSVVLDFGAGDCGLINSVEARRRIAVDINPDVRNDAAEGVEVRVGPMVHGDLMGECDLIVASNVFEHLTDAEHLMEVLGICREALKPGGRLIVLQPNFRYAYKEFYDYLDHRLPLTHNGLAEALEAADLEVLQVVPRFLPYSAKKQRLRAPWILRLYLRLPLVWPVFGKQMLVVARVPRVPAPTTTT